jgi:hypothetical protein
LQLVARHLDPQSAYVDKRFEEMVVRSAIRDEYAVDIRSDHGYAEQAWQGANEDLLQRFEPTSEGAPSCLGQGLGQLQSG